MKKIITILAAVVLCGLVVPAFSAVENVKVGGDIVVKGIYRNNFDFHRKDANHPNRDGNSCLYTGARIYVSAELTDKVSAMVRFLNEQDWGRNGVNPTDNERNVLTDLAYIKVSDLLVPGLDLTVGRQEIQIADGLVVGSAYRASTSNYTYTDYGLQKAFDAIKLDYAFTAAPVTVSAFKAKTEELYDNRTGSDTDLYGLDVVIKGENLVINPYYVAFVKNAPKTNQLNTIGLKIGWQPMEALSISGEYAKQFGKDKATRDDYKGWAATIGVDYKFATNMSPTISAMYADFSGRKTTATDWKNWVPVFPSNIASRVGRIAYPALFSDGEGSYDIGNGSGVRSFKLGFGLQPIEKVGLSLDWFNLTAKETAGNIDDAVGNEIDLTVNYAYSEDLKFGLELGYLIAGNYIEDTLGKNNTKNAWQAIATMQVAF